MIKPKEKIKKGQTMQYQLTVRFISLLVVAVVVLSTAITTMTIVSIYESTKDQTKLLLTSLRKSEATSEKEWQKLLNTHIPNDNSPNFIRVVLESGEIVYSEEAQELYNEFPAFKQLIVTKRIVWDQLEPYYYKTIVVDRATISVLVELEDNFEIIGQIVSFTIILTLIVIILGGVLTYRFAEKISRSLNRMNREIMALSKNDSHQAWLTEPLRPIEVANISKSFNQLISAQRTSVKREKQFVTDASHELRTPLTAIRGHVNLIKRRGQEHPEVIPKSIDYLDKESKRMEVLVEQLLTVGRQERGSKLIDLSKLVDETIVEFQLVHPRRLVSKVEQGITLIGIQEQFYQIIRNLVENALKYSEEGEEVTVTLMSDKTTITLIVVDTGIGISNKDKSLVFDRFYRADQSRSSLIKGSGIGLSIVHTLVEQYEGAITISDNQPKGSIFKVTLPLT
ncbi:HAMP domain-containing sensor histidine kinase [uncultured Vagococcus sp.]|uniref:sensor histidine kinase n=1 Tax=uncultured Vagococcus sp. TaxID=189676 RepID=UPI0028D38E10|nr:HAMP domain-containing sensor histidine kinase [uncultured Vagococcus sp.]